MEEEFINLNHVFDKVTKDEGKKESVNRAQVAEVCSLFLKEMAGWTPAQLDEVMARYATE